MGLCKCPKRRITNQFCYEHRVNVCEHCMVTNHPKCIVQSYVYWLGDSDYHPICELCTGRLADGECIRLVCYHVFHWNCIAEYGRKIPVTTGPDGYKCPTCKKGLFPASNLVSPVADVLKEKLVSVNWARAGLGLPLLIENEAPPAAPLSSTPESTPRQHAVVHVDPAPTYQLPRRVVQDYDDDRKAPFDHDEDKYKRRTPWDWVLRRWKTLWRPVPRGRNFLRRYLARLILVVVVLCTCFVILSWLGGIVTRDDPSLEIHNNPNIRVAKLQET